MKNKSLLLSALILTFSLAACGKSENPSNSGISQATFMNNGECSYAVLLPENADNILSYAANEFVARIEDASEVTLPIRTEVKAGERYISLGKTSLFLTTFQKVDLSALKDTQSAYYRDYLDGNIYLVSSDEFAGYGVLYGVYDLLNELCGYEYYASDEIYVDQTRDMSFYERKNDFVFPSFDSRSVSTYSLIVNGEYRQRMRNIMPGAVDSPWNQATWGHGTIGYFLPYTTYGVEHPDWYMNSNSNPNSNQLCLSAGQEMEDEIFKKFQQFLTEDKTSSYFMFAQQDISHGCECEKCKAALADWAMNYQGQQVDFMNRMIDRVDAWLSENQPGREVYYVVYGYQYTYQPPIVEEKGTYRYFSNRVIPNEKIRFMVAPVEGNYSYPYDAPVNNELLQGLKKWDFYAKNRYMIYMYDCNFKYYFVNFNNFGSLKRNMEIAREQGSYYYFTNACSDAASGCFNELRTYVESRLGWDLSLDPDELTRDFFTHYYKVASTPLYAIFEMIRDQYAVYDNLITKPSSNNIYANILSKELWPYESVRRMEMYINEAFAAIAPYEESDPALYRTLSLRIYKEYLSVVYLKVKLYRSYLSDEEVMRLRTIWETYTTLFGMTKEAEGYDNIDIF